MRRSGLALIVVVGVLGVFSALAVAFVTMAQLERKASQQRVNAERAYLLAKSGIEDALARLGMGQDPQASSNRYGGEDWNANGVPDPIETANEVYHPGVLDVDACPVRYAMRPSFFTADSSTPARNPLTVPVDGRQRGYSGLLAGDWSPLGNHYALKAAGQGFWLNGGDPTATSSVGYNAVLRRMLGTLADAIDHEDGVGDGNPVSTADGWALIDKRPRNSTGWKSFDQIRDLALGGNQAKLDALRGYITLSAWTDKRVIHPNVTTVMEGKKYRTWADIKLDHGPIVSGTRAPGFERAGAAGTRIVGRAPVDLPWARTRRPALIALLAGLKGLYLNEGASTPAGIATETTDLIGTMCSAEIVLDWTQASDECRNTADRILASTSDLATWQQFGDFCDTLPFSGTSDLPQAKRDLLKANFNPNSDLNKFGPNPSVWKLVDKSDLMVYSTEFSLFSVQGVRVESVGRVLDAGGRLLARRTLEARWPGPLIARLSTQSEFVGASLGNLDLPGDEATWRLPGTSSPFITLNQGPADSKTWGHTLAGMGGAGAALQSYPEPYVRPGATLRITPADYDGRLELATVETPVDEWYGVASTTRVMKCLARFDDRFDLDVAGGAATFQQDTPKQVTTALLGNSLLDDTIPNTFYPDGAYSERDRAVTWLDAGNANGLQGVLSFWVKPNYTLIRRESDAVWRGRPWVDWTNAPAADGSPISIDQFFLLGDLRFYNSGIPVFARAIRVQMEMGHAGSDADNESRFEAYSETRQGHRWLLVTFYYDLRHPKPQTVGDGVGDLRIDDGRGFPNVGQTNDYTSSVTDPTMASDFTIDVNGVAHSIRLGVTPSGAGAFSVNQRAGTGADATFDEFAIYDFGGSGADGVPAADANTRAAAGILAQARFAEGRYYRESAYANDPLNPDHFPGNPTLFPGNTAAQWFSAPITLGRVRIRALAWTQIVPPGLRAPLDAAPDGRVAFDLSDACGLAYLRDASGQDISDLFAQDSMSPVDRVVNAPLRLHAVFQPNLADPSNTPILDPLALDDVTILYEPAFGMPISSWQEIP